MPDPLAAAEVFLHVVRAGGFTPAARALGRDASSLSRTVAELERNLGAQLIARTTRRLHLTEAGLVYVAHAEALLAAHRAGRDAITEFVGGSPRGNLKVSMPVSVGERLLAPYLPAFYRRFPELRLQIDLSDRNVAVLQGGFDLAIRVGRPSTSSLRAQLLGRVPTLLVASPGYVAGYGAPEKPADLASHRCIVVGGLSRPTEWVLSRGSKQESVAIAGIVRTTSPSLGARLAVAGFGVLRTTEWVIRDELASGQLTEIMLGWRCHRTPNGGVPVFVLYAQGAEAVPPLKSRVFVDLIKSVMAREVLSNYGTPSAVATRESIR